MNALARIAHFARAVVSGGDAGFPGVSEYFWNQPWNFDREELNYARAAGQIATVYACLSRISQDIASIPVRFFEKRKGKWELLDDSHPLPTFWEQGNTEQSQYEIVRDWQAYCDNGGKSYLFLERGKSGKSVPFEYWPVQGHLMHPVPGPHRRVVEYQDARTFSRYPAESVIPLNHWNPNADPNEPAPVGLSPLAAGRQSYEALWNASLWLNQFFKVGGSVATMFKPSVKDRLVTQDEVKNAREQLMKQSTGPKNFGKPVVLSGLEPVRTGLTMQEMQLPELSQEANLAICRVLQVPPVLIGIKDGGGLSDAGATTDLLLYDQNCLGPRAMLISKVLTKRLCPLFGKDLACELDIDALPAMQKAKLEQAKTMVMLTGRPVIEVDEAREALELDPAGNGEGKGLVAPFNVVFVKDLTSDIRVQPGAPGDKANSPEPGPAAPAPVKDDTSTSQGEGVQARRLVASGDPKVQMRRMRDADLGRYERRVAAWARGRFAAQERIALERLAGQAEDRVQAKLAYRPDELVDPGEGDGEAQRLYDQIILERGEAAAAEVGAEVALKVHQGRLAEMITHRAASMVSGIDQTTQERLARVIGEAEGEGSSFDDIAAAVRAVFDGRRANALTIARTETAWAYNLASKEAWDEAGVGWKSWLTVGDDAVREEHVACEAEGVIPMSQPFSNGLMTPGDPNGAAESVINCRCVLQPELTADGSLSRFFDRTRGRSLDALFAGVDA